MAPLRCCSFNCRGWNSGSLFLRDVIDSFDLLLNLRALVTSKSLVHNQ